MRERSSERIICGTIRWRFATRVADSFKTSEGSALPLYSYKKPRAGTKKRENGLYAPAHKCENCDKVERSQEETPKRDTQSASPGIIAARRKAGPGRTTRKRGGK